MGAKEKAFEIDEIFNRAFAIVNAKVEKGSVNKVLNGVTDKVLDVTWPFVSSCNDEASSQLTE